MRFRRIQLLAAVLLLPVATMAQNYISQNLDYYIQHAPFKMPVINEPVFKSETYNIKDYGAVGDGATLNTTAFEKAIAACSAAGGGTVIIPPGLWLTGPIELKSNINMQKMVHS